MAKVKTITLAHGRINPQSQGPHDKDAIGYTVLKVTDSLEFDPGQFVTKAEADSLCRSREWKVTITK